MHDLSSYSNFIFLLGGFFIAPVFFKFLVFLYAYTLKKRNQFFLENCFSEEILGTLNRIDFEWVVLAFLFIIINPGHSLYFIFTNNQIYIEGIGHYLIVFTIFARLTYLYLRRVSIYNLNCIRK